MAKRIKCSDCKWSVPKQAGHAELCDSPQTFVSVGRLGTMRQTTSSARWDTPDMAQKCGKAARFFEARP